MRAFYMSHSEILDLKASGVSFIGTANESDAIDVKQADFENSVIIFGNEGQGISEELLEICDKKIKIPLSSDCESINVAAAASIIIWEAKGRRDLCHH